jgi:hypothetical protein
MRAARGEHRLQVRAYDRPGNLASRWLTVRV